MSSLQDKMYNYEVPPPANGWEKIAAALDEEAAEFPSRLYNMEVAPPADTWTAITNLLEEADEKVVPIRRKAPAFFRYAAAAVVIGAVAFGIIKFTSGSGNTGETTADQTFSTKDSNTNNIPSAGKNVTASINNETTDEPEPGKRTVANLEDRPFRVKNAIVRENIDADADANAMMYAYDDPEVNIADRYIMLMTPEGNIIRMSKKLGDLVCCVSGEEQDENCKSQLKKWQEKIANAPISPSPDNFMDILNLVNSLDEGVDL